MASGQFVAGQRDAEGDLAAMLHLVWANLFRAKLRTFVTVVCVAVAVGSLFCILSFQKGYENGLHNEMNRLGAHLIVVPKGCPYDAASIALHGAAWPCYLKASYLTEVEQTPRVALAAPVLMTAFFDDSGGQNVYCGITERMAKLKNWQYSAGGFCNTNGSLLAGNGLAKSRHWQVGDTVILRGIEGEKSATVSGILTPSSGADDLFAYLPLADAERLFKRTGLLTHILVRLQNPDDLDTVAANLRGCDAGMDMNVVPLAHLFTTIQNLARSTRTLLETITIAALLAAACGVANALLMAVTERTREIGVLRAIGASPEFVFGLVWLESLFIGLIGGILGIALSLTSGSLLESGLRSTVPFAPKDRLLTGDFMVALLCVLGGAALSTVAAVLPAFRASRLSPALAVREE